MLTESLFADECEPFFNSIGQERTSRGLSRRPLNNSEPTSAVAQSVVSGDALDVLQHQIAWRQITDVAYALLSALLCSEMKIITAIGGL